MRKALEIGGYIAAVVLIAFGAAAIYMGISGRSTVSDSIKAEQVVGSADMTPSAITQEVKAAGLTNVTIPSCSVDNKVIASGTDARCFAQYMRIHALEASGGLTYSQLGRYAAKDGNPKGTNEVASAATDEKTGAPLPNSVRDTWVTETALSTALYVSFMADNLALFGIVVGIALLLSGIGFMILAILSLGGGSPAKSAPEPEGAAAPAAG
jgi:hypothetical protein